jgi:nucleotide-binding universal stress UspA family protein
MKRYRNILLATDFSEQARKALAEAVRLARRHEARLHVLHVEIVALQPPGMAPDPVIPDYIRNLGQVSMGAGQDLELNYRNAVVKVVRDSSEAAGIVRYAEENGIDLIVIGTHGRGAVPEMLFGSVAQTVVRQARVPVLVVGPQAGGQHARCVLAPVDLSERSAGALAQAGRLAADAGSRLQVLHVVDFSRVAHPEALEIGERERHARDDLARLVTEVEPAVAADLEVAVGPAAPEILRLARKHDAGLIVMAESGHGNLERLVIGSVCKAVVRAAPCPVLVHREPAGSPGQRAAA